jgi:hypothetical protein
MFVERVFTKEVHCGHGQLGVALVTCLLVECLRGLLLAVDLLLHILDVFHVLLHLVVVFVNAFDLTLQLCEQKAFKDFESKHVGLALLFF